MSIDGLLVATTGRVDMSRSLTNRVRMSLALDATMKSATLAAHPLRRPAGEDVAEVAGGHARRDRLAQRPGGGHVVHGLGHHTRPVDRVDRREPHPLAEPDVVEHRLHEVLAVVERAIDGDGAHVRCVDGGHLPALHVARATVGVEHHDVDPLAVADRLDGRRAGVTARGADDGEALVALGQHVVEQQPDELQGDVLERQRRAVEQLGQPLAVVDLHQWHDGGMAERRVRAVAQGVEVDGVEVVTDERPDHGGGRVGVGGAAREHVVGGERRPRLGHVQPAVARQARQEHVGEAERRRHATRRDVLHRPGAATGDEHLVAKRADTVGGPAAVHLRRGVRGAVAPWCGGKGRACSPPPATGCGAAAPRNSTERSERVFERRE